MSTLSEAIRKSWEDPAIRQRRIDGLRRVQSQPEAKAKASERMRNSWQDPLIRAKRIEGLRRAHAEGRRANPKNLSAGLIGENGRHPQWKGDAVGYRAMHARIVQRRGKARERDCTDCEKKACDWSQIHGTAGKDVMDYEPRCRRCHLKYDGVNA